MLRNMGSQASLSFSALPKEELWQTLKGLCLHETSHPGVDMFSRSLPFCSTCRRLLPGEGVHNLTSNCSPDDAVQLPMLYFDAWLSNQLCKVWSTSMDPMGSG